MLPEWIRQGVRPVTVSYDECGRWDVGTPFEYIPQAPDIGSWARLPGATLASDWRYCAAMARRLEPLIAEHGLNVIYSFANPRQSNVIGAMLARRTGIPYVAHFSDPWFGTTHRRTISTVPLELAALERFTVNAASRVTVVDEPMRRFIMDKYPERDRAKSVVVPHCFDPAVYPDVPRRADDRFVIVHAGVLYRKRTPEVLFAAVRGIIQRRPDIAARIRLRLIGAFNTYANYGQADLERLRQRYDIPPAMLSVEPPVGYVESLRAMREADCLVAIDPPETYFIASKIIDYAGANRPILAIAPRGAPSADVVTQLGFRAFSYDEGGDLAQYLISLADGKESPVVNESYRDIYDVRNTTALLFSIFRSVLADSAA